MLQPRRICRKVHAIGGELQKNICRRDRHLLKEIVKGVEIGMDECQYQLRYHRWNCTTRRRSLGKMLLRGEEVSLCLAAFSMRNQGADARVWISAPALALDATDSPLKRAFLGLLSSIHAVVFLHLTAYRHVARILAKSQTVFPCSDTKEAAFVHATTASAVAHVVANACGKGRLKSCTCHQTRRYRAADGRWFWGGKCHFSTP